MVEHKPAAASRRPVRQQTALRIVPGSLRARPELLRSTALQAVFLAAIALPAGHAGAQTMPAPTALPTGGQTIAGSHTIAVTSTPTSASMVIGQPTAYGAINWNKFDVGAKASVTINVPTAQSVSVHRVVTSSPSVIAGQVNSNGVVVISNQSGVVFTQGAEVNVSTLIASAPGISEANARAGRLIFDQPAQAGAKVENHGTITVAQTGLAALVAPQVANSGVIRAQMGRVVLAGAEAHTIDLYGDGLLSIDVTRQVMTAPTSRDGKTATALVTNSGIVIADGGTILLTASAVDGLVQTLVTSGGILRANSVATPAGSAAGRIAITAAGGNVAVTGTIAARGEVTGSKGGQIEINAPARSVTLHAGAAIDASGRAGGGSIAIGTTMARAQGGTAFKAPTAHDVIIESGARIAADATLLGKGGDITVLSQGGVTEHRGALSARGGPDGGDGGFIEVSGSHFIIGGRIDTGAPAGVSGSILLDPNDLEINDAGSSKIGSKNTFTAAGKNTLTVISPTEIRDNMTGAITLQTDATGTLKVSSTLDLTLKNSSNKTTGITSLTLLSDGNMTISAAVTGADNITLKNTAGNLAISAPITTADGKTVTLISAGSIALAANIGTGATGIIDLTAGAGGVTQSAAGSLVAGTLLSSSGIAGGVSLNSATNNLGGLGAITVTGGNFALVNSAALTVTGALVLDAGKTASFAAPGFTITTGSVASAGGTFELAPTSGAMSLGAATAKELVLTQATLDKISVSTIQLGRVGGVTASSIALNDALDISAATTARLIAGTGGMTLTKGPLTAGTLDLATTGGGITDAGGVIVATRLQSTGGITGAVTLGTSVHSVGTLGDMTVSGGGLTLINGVALNVAGKVQLGGDSFLLGFAASAKAIEVTGTLALSTAGKLLTLATVATGGITLAGSVDTTSAGLLNLVGGSLGVTQIGGAITTGVLTATSPIAGTTKLAQAANAIGSIADLVLSAGDLIVTSATAIAVTGAVSADNITLTSSAASKVAIDVSGSLTAGGATGVVALVASDATGGIALSGAVTASKGSIDLSAGSFGVVQTTGSLTALNLLSTGGIGGTATLISASNAIDATGGIKVSGGDLLLASANTLDIAGTLAVDAGRTIALALPAFKLATGALSAAGGTVEIAPLGGGSMSLGKAAAAELTITAADLGKISSATLRLGGSAATAAVADSLVVRDAFDASVAATAVLRLDAGVSGITINDVALKANTLDLNATGSGVNAISGALVTANRVQSSAGITGDVTLSNDIHAIGTIGDMAVTTGLLGLRTGLALDVAGKVSANIIVLIGDAAAGTAIAVNGSLTTVAGGTAVLIATNAAKGGITFGGNVDVSSTGKLDINAGADGVVQSGGSVVAGSLVSSGGVLGAVTLGQAGNAVAEVGNLTTIGAFTLNTSSAVTIDGKLTADSIAITSTSASATAINATGTLTGTGAVPTIALAASTASGGIALSGTVDATAGTVDLSAGTGGVTQTTGAILAANLRSTGNVAGAVALDAGGNKIASLGAFALTGIGNFSLTNAAGLQVSGAVGTGAGNISLVVTTAGTLEVAAPLTTGAGRTITLRASDAAGAVVLGANVDAGSTGIVDLSAGTGGITQTAGGLTTGTLRSGFGADGTVKLTSATNAVTTLGSMTVSAGDLVLVNAGGLAISGPVNVGAGTFDISTSAGSGVTSSGVITAGMLRSSLGITGTLKATGDNAIAQIGAITATGGDIILGNQTGSTLTIAGAVTVGAGRTIRLEADATTITTGSLNAAGGTIELLAPTAAISLGAVNGGDLAVLQTDFAAFTADRINLTSKAAGITLRADLDTSAATPLLRLNAATGVVLTAGTLTTGGLELVTAANGATQTGGVLAAKNLVSGAGGITGPVTLDNAANTIAGIGDLATTGAISITSAALLDVTGTVKATGIALTGSAAGAALNLAATGALVLGAPGTITLTTSAATGSTALAGTIDAGAGGTLQLAGIGTVSQTAGKITAGTLATSGSIGGADLGQASNAIATLGKFAAAGDLTLVTTQALSAAATVSAANATLRSSAASASAIAISSADFSVAAGGTIALAASNGAGGIVLTGKLDSSVTGVLDLSAGSAGVNQSAGSVTTGTLRSTGGIGGALLLAQANVISGLGPLAVNGAITLASTTSLAVDAPVSAGNGTTLSLSAAGMSFTGTGALTATGGTIEIGPNNATASFGLGGAAGGFALGDLTNITATLVRIGQASSAGNSNKAASIALSGTVAPNATTLDLISSGTISQSTGGLSIPVLTATAAALGIAQGGNTIGALGPFAVAGDLALASDGALAVGGTLSASSITLRSFAASSKALDISGVLNTAAGGTITLVAANGAGGIALSGKLNASATGTVDLSAGSGGINQSAGSITAGTLRSGSGATGAVVLDQAGNAISTLGNFAVTGAALVLRDSLALDIAGAVSGTAVTIRDSASGTALTVSGSVTSTGTTLLEVTDKAAGIALSGTLKAGTLDMTAGSGGIAQAAGSITAATLQSTGGSAGTVALGETANSVAALGGFAVTGGDFTLIDSAALTVSGALSAANVTLRGDAAASKAIDVSGSIKTGAGGTLTLAATNAAGGIALSGALDASVTGAVDLSAGTGGIGQTGSGITAGSLRSTGGATGAVALTQAANAIGRLDNFVVTGNSFALTDASALNVAGTVKATGITLVGSAAGTAITVNGALDAGTGTLGLQASNAAGGLVLAGTVAGGAVDLIAGSGGIAQPGGSLTATTLTIAVAGGSATLGQTANSIANLGNATITGGSLTVADSVAMTVSGAVTANAITLTDSAAGTAFTINGSLTTAAGGTVTLTASNVSGGIDLGGSVNASATGIVDLSAGGNVSQSGGGITAGTLRSTGGIGGDLVLDKGGNAIGAIGKLAVTGDAAIADNVALDVTGPFTATNITLVGTAAGADAIRVSGSISATNAIVLENTAATGGIALAGTVTAASLDARPQEGGLIQSAGAVTAGSLTASSIFGKVELDQPGNAIGTLGKMTAASIVLRDSIPLTIAGPLSAADITLRNSAASASALNLTGTLNAGNVLLETSAPTGGIALSGVLDAGLFGTVKVATGNGGITQTGGTVKAGVLTGKVAGGDIVLTQPANQILNLINLDATGGTVTVVTSIGDLGVNGLRAKTISLKLQTVGSINVAVAGITTGPGGLVRLDAASATGGVAIQNGTLDASATGTVDITTGSAGVFENNGAIIAGTLMSSGTIGGAVVLGGGNAIGTIGDLAVTAGGFTLANTIALAITGKLAAPNVTLSNSNSTISLAGTGTIAAPGGAIALSTANGGGILLAGQIDAAAGSLDLSAGSGGITQTAGTITAGTLQSSGGIGGTAAFDQVGNAISVLGPITVSAGNLSITDALTLTVAGPVTIAAGNLTITNSAASAGAIAVTGAVTVSGTTKLTATAPAGGILLGNVLKAAALDLVAGSAGVTQTGGMLTLGLLTNAGLNGPVSLTQASNGIANIGTFAVGVGDIAIVNAIPLTIGGPLGAAQGAVTITGLASGPAAINVAGSVVSGPGKATTLATPNGAITVAIGGQVAAPGGLLSLGTSTGVTAPGTLVASKLAASASSAGNIALTGANAIATLVGASLADGTFTLNNTAPLAISGPVTARLFGITAAGSITVGDGVAFTTDGLDRSAQKIDVKLTDPQIAALTTSQLGSFLAIAGGGGPGKIATGNITVAPFSASKATIDFVLPQPDAGTISIGQLVGKATDLILVTRQNGIATGTVDVAGLLVLGSGGKADLFGTIGGLDGQAAANKAGILALPNANYRFNACPITSINCVLLPVQTIPPISPLRDVPIIRDRPTQDDADVQLPNVSDEDY